MIRKPPVDFRALKRSAASQLKDLQEIKQLNKLKLFLEADKRPNPSFSTAKGNVPRDKAATIISSALVNMLLHVESRVASFVGQGFYTIGPCGEENLACLGILANEKDPFALHYRHLAASVSRQLNNGRPIDDIIMDRARGYTISRLDPVTGGKHCALGGTPFDFYVTSTLASQGPPAVARALGFSLSQQVASSMESPKQNGTFEAIASKLGTFPKDSISVVSTGDGSVNNNLMLSALNFSDYSAARGYKVPVLFIVTNNDICISLKNQGSIDTFIKRERVLKNLQTCDGMDVFDTYSKMKSSIDTVRKTRKPGVLILNNIPRRFGHAATDRQNAYFSPNEIQDVADRNPIEGIIEAFESLDYCSRSEVLEEVGHLENLIEESFQKASNEEKISSREQAAEHTSVPRISVEESFSFYSSFDDIKHKKTKKPGTMRENMTKVYDEILSKLPHAVYVGEDVRHGGYYLVTKDLAAKHGPRVMDIPPDETMLSAFGMGFSQCGLLPIVEFPYAKYLDCGADMFFESIITTWCTNGKEKNGILFRLQGFDKGVFGGNYHTHNSLHSAPGLDLVCYSNGEDYVRGIRYCAVQAQQGRVVMSVDSTDLLNKRGKMWMHYYPNFDETNSESATDFFSFDDIAVYRRNPDISEDFPVTKKLIKASEPECEFDGIEDGTILIYTYGNGVHTAVEAISESDVNNVIVVDAPYLSAVPSAFAKMLNKIKSDNLSVRIVFADVCKEGSSPLSGQIVRLQKQRLLPNEWRYVAAQNTYNPLGNLSTFLSKEDILGEINSF